MFPRSYARLEAAPALLCSKGMDGELTVAILREIRDEIRSTRDTLSERIDHLEGSLGSRIDSLGSRIDTTNLRLDLVEHTARDLAEQMLTVTRYVKNVATRHDDAIEDLDERVTKLETQKI